MALPLSIHFTVAFDTLYHFIATLPASNPPALAFSACGKDFLAAPISAHNEAMHVFTDNLMKPFQAILFEYKVWGPEGRVVRLHCPDWASDIVQELFKLHKYPYVYPEVKTPTNNHPSCTLEASYLNVHVGHDNSDRCALIDTRQRFTTTTVPTLTEDWPISPGQWIVAHVTIRRFQTQCPHAKEFHVTASALRILE
ncbi:hypothetical protein B0H17DRAFT_1204688 [Mycena rosella]|uniref:Uncharacterized protein n=1 Tax=Mycena rosella TaxID=1033263 RepID=A0AAD7DAA1_MYCRO|nr:hypothetical protein B0H17DRAFT_1204688 [Mycena rosella]